MKKITKNYLYNMTYQILVMIIPIITTPYISRVLGAECIGEYNYAYSIVSMLLIVAQLGTNLYGQREIAYVQSDKEKRSTVFWNIYFLRILVTFIILGAYIGTLGLIGEGINLFAIMAIYLISNLFDIGWYFQGLEDFRRIVVRNIGVKIIGVVLIFAFVKDSTDLNVYALILSVAQLGGNLYLFTNLSKNIFAPNFSAINLRQYIKPIIILFIPTASINLYTYLDKITLGFLSTNTQLGYYSQTEKIIKLLMTVITSLGTVMLPHISVSIANKDLGTVKSEISNAISFVFFIGLPLMAGCIVIANRFIPFFLGPDFINATIIFQVLSPLIIIIGLASVAGQSTLIPLKKQKAYSISIFSGVLVNVTFNLLLIPRLGALGAAIGTIMAESTVTTIQISVMRKNLELIIFPNKKAIISYLVGSCFILTLGTILNSLLPDGILYFVLIIIMCCICYFIILIVARDKYLTVFLNKIKYLSFGNR